VPPRRLAKVKNRLRDGEHCLGLILDGNILSWSFYSTKPQDIIEGLYELKAGEVMGEDLFTLDHNRGKGFAICIYCARNKLLLAKGFLHEIGVIDKRNHASLNLFRKMGATIIGEVKYRRFLRAVRRSFHHTESPIPMSKYLPNKP